MVKNKHFSFWWLSGVVLAIIVLLLTAVVYSQDGGADVGNGLRITPVRQELILTPGQSDTYSIELTNVSSGDMKVFTIVNDFESDGVSGSPRLLVAPNESSPFSLREYITLPDPFELKAGDTKSVTIDVNMPSEISAGAYFGAIRFAPGPNSDVNPGNVALTASVASILLVSIPGDVPEGMTLEKISAKRGSNIGPFFETPPEIVAVTLKNTGNTLLKPFGQVVVKDLFGNEAYKYELNSSGQIRSNVLPQSSRVFEDPIENISRIGRYTVEANISYNEGGGTILVGKITFWVIPWKVILAVIAVLAAIIWFSTKGVKTYNRRVVERSKRNS